MKKIALTVAVLASLGLAACGGNGDTAAEENAATDLNVTTEEATEDLNAADNALDEAMNATENATNAVENATENATTNAM
jgi:ABC-type glycerol-3-phosphate transport system substrate-binding protein